jgi:lactobin A/cerein 7B family class IIb bacteriocin
MKRLDFKQMENLQGGWWRTPLQHIGCGLMAAAATGLSGGWAGPAAYIGCLLILSNEVIADDGSSLMPIK